MDCKSCVPTKTSSLDKSRKVNRNYGLCSMNGQLECWLLSEVPIYKSLVVYFGLRGTGWIAPRISPRRISGVCGEFFFISQMLLYIRISKYRILDCFFFSFKVFHYRAGNSCPGPGCQSEARIYESRSDIRHIPVQEVAKIFQYIISSVRPEIFIVNSFPCKVW
jgi:hypothetical protein